MWACDWHEDMRDDSPPSLLHRILHNSTGDLRGAAMVLPRSWIIALEMLEALGSGRQVKDSTRPVETVVAGNFLVDSFFVRWSSVKSHFHWIET